MKIIALQIIFILMLSGNFLSCDPSNQTGLTDVKTKNTSINETSSSLADANEILQKVGKKYDTFIFYKTKAENFYTRKGFEEEKTVKRAIELEYSFPSVIKAELHDDKGTKTLESKSNVTYLLIDGERKKTFDDLYWGLTSTEFGDGVFFEVGIILILKERGTGENSSFQTIVNPTIVAEEIIDGRICYKIEGSLKTDDLATVTYWIDKESYLIRQYERLLLAKKIPNGYSKTVETYTDIEAR